MPIKEDIEENNRPEGCSGPHHYQVSTDAQLILCANCGRIKCVMRAKDDWANKGRWEVLY